MKIQLLDFQLFVRKIKGIRVFYDKIRLKMEVGSSCCLNELYTKKPIPLHGNWFFGFGCVSLA